MKNIYFHMKNFFVATSVKFSCESKKQKENEHNTLFKNNKNWNKFIALAMLLQCCVLSFEFIEIQKKKNWENEKIKQN